MDEETGWMDLPREIREYIYFLRHRMLLRQCFKDIWDTAYIGRGMQRRYRRVLLGERSTLYVLRKYDGKDFTGDFWLDQYRCVTCGVMLQRVLYPEVQASQRVAKRKYGDSYQCSQCCDVFKCTLH